MKDPPSDASWSRLLWLSTSLILIPAGLFFAAMVWFSLTECGTHIVPGCDFETRHLFRALVGGPAVGALAITCPAACTYAVSGSSLARRIAGRAIRIALAFTAGWCAVFALTPPY